MNAARARSILAPPAAGALLAFSMPPWGWWPLAFVAFALLDRLIAGRPARSRAAIGCGFALGWLFPATFWMIDLTLPGYFAQGFIFMAFFGLATLAVPSGRWRWLALPAAFVLVEALRWRWPFGGVPLATLPMSQSDAPLGLTVRILGPLLLAALVVAAGMGLSALWERRHATGAAILVGVVLVGVLARVAPSGEVIETIDVAIVQGGGPQGTRAINTNARDVFDRHMAASELVETPVDVVMWPEDVVNVTTLVEGTQEWTELQQLARDLDAWLIAGIFERLDPTTNANASVAFTPEGEAVSRYDKVRLVPFGEFVPLRSLIEPLAPAYLPARDTRPGTGPAQLEIEIDGRPVTMGVAISWEIFFEDRARAAMGNDAEILLNPTNGSSYWLTILQSQQVASSRLRAMETGKWVLQAAPTGFSAVVSPEGEVLQRTAVSEQAVLADTVELRSGSTLATRLGPTPMLLVAAAAIAAAWAMSRRSTIGDDRTDREDQPVAAAATRTGAAVPSVVDLDQQGDGTVVDELDGHVGAETAGGDGESRVP
ncbi:MAG: apolipoprotein N-acyltransferase [Acidimicrobiales bacterium]